jgi:unsaturated rhamnogalacturonyl hydrolase
MNPITRIGLLALLLVSALPAAGQTNYLETDDSIRTLLIRVADRQLRTTASGSTLVTLADGSYPVATTLSQAQSATPPSGIAWTYPWGVNLYGLLHAYRATGNTNYLNFVRNQNLIVGRYYFWLTSLTNSLGSTSGLNTWQRTTALGELFRLDRLDFCGSMTASFLEGVLSHSAAITNEQVEVVQNTANWIAGGGQSRLPDGTLWRTNASPNFTIWGDDLYMACPFLVRWYLYTGDARHLDDAAQQIINMAGYLQAASGIWYHGYYVSNSPPAVNGIKWGRANGWAMVATTEVLNVMPTNHPARSNLLSILRRHIDGIKSVQQPSGMWRQILDFNSPTNWPETSCSAMFSYCIARAANQGWIDRTNLAVARKGFAGLSTNINAYGEVANTCVGTGIGTTISFYMNRPRGTDEMHGRGAVQLAAAEILMSPKLNIAAEGSNAAVTWPAGITNDALESSADLASWTDIPTAPVTTSNWLSRVAEPMSGAAFYRLRLESPAYPPAPLAFEAESLAWTTNGATAVVSTLDTNASGGYFVTLNGDGANDYIQFTLTNVPAGMYRLKLNFKSNTNRGNLALTVDGQPMSSTLDQYWNRTFYPLMDFGRITFAAAGDHAVRLTVAGKHGASAGYTVTADRFLLAPE